MPISTGGTTTATITANSQRQTFDVAGYPAAVVTVSGTYSGVNLLFEVSDDSGTTYFPVAAVRQDTLAQDLTSGVLTANTSRAWTVPTGGFNLLSVRSTAWTNGTATLRVTPTEEADALLSAGTGGGGGGGAATVADGANVVEGATTDAAVVTDTTGTMNGKLRGLVKWAFERMPSALGTNTMANSLPVTLASDGPAVTVLGTTTDAANTTGTTGSNSGKLRGLVTLLAAGVDLVNSRLKTTVYGTATNPGDTAIDASTVGADGTSNTTNRLRTSTHGAIFNGTTWDRMRGSVLGLWVQGPGAAGAAISGNPVLAGGSDGTNARALLTDTSGNILIRPASPATTTGTVTGSAQTVSAALAGYPTALVTITGTYTGLTIIFEGSDDSGTTWLTFYVTQIDNNLANTSNSVNNTFSLAATQAAFRAQVAGYTNLRVRSTAFSTGTATVRITPCAESDQPALYPISLAGAPPSVSAFSNDGLAASTFGNGLAVHAQSFLFNGTGTEKQRNNIEATLLASASRATTTNAADQTNYNGRGVLLLLDVTATPNDAQTLTVEIQAKDSISAKYVTITAFTALVASALGATPTTETYVYTLYAGGAETVATPKHEVQALVLPRVWRARVVHSAAGSWTYSLSAEVIL